MTAGGQGLLDTSVFIARETERPIGPLPSFAAISVVTLAELHLGVLMADDHGLRARRLLTLTSVQAAFQPLPINAEVARAFAEIVAEARRSGRRPGIMDVWIAATALDPWPPGIHAGRRFPGDPAGAGDTCLNGGLQELLSVQRAPATNAVAR